MVNRIVPMGLMHFSVMRCEFMLLEIGSVFDFHYDYLILTFLFAG